MENSFAQVMSNLRKARGLSQRHVAADLEISQALLSHYENGAREPGLNFVIKACDYYSVSADYLLGRTTLSCGYAEKLEDIRGFAAQLRAMAESAERLSEENAE